MTQPTQPESEQQPTSNLPLKHLQVERSLTANPEAGQRIEQADTLLSSLNAMRKISTYYTNPKQCRKSKTEINQQAN